MSKKKRGSCTIFFLSLLSLAINQLGGPSPSIFHHDKKHIWGDGGAINEWAPKPHESRAR